MTPPPSKLLRPEERLRLEATPTRTSHSDEATLVDALDHLLNRGAVLVGEAVISLADVELVYVGLNLLVSSVETLREASPPVASPPRPLSSGVERGGGPRIPSPSAEGEG
jgi:gas vesicle structural protein